MGSQWTRPILRGIKTSAFLFAVLIVSTIVVIQSPRQTHAEGLLYTVGCSVVNLLTKVCQKPTTETTAPAPTTTQPATSTQTTTPQATPSSEPMTTQVATEPISEGTPAPLDTSTLQPIHPAAKTTETQPMYSYPSRFLMSIGQGSYSSEVMRVTTEDSYLQATPQGWRFMGMLWYWWIIIIGVIVGGVGFIRSSVTKSFFSVVK